MTVHLYMPVRAFRQHLSLAEFAREARLSQSTVQRRAERNEIGRYWQDNRRKKPDRWMYFVADLPLASGSQYLIDYLERTASFRRQEVRDLEDKMHQAMLARRTERAA